HACVSSLLRPAFPTRRSSDLERPPRGADADRLADSAAGLQTVLQGNALIEYELRESPTAARLRGAARDLSEREFREAFALLRAVDRKSTRLNSSHVKISYAVF